MTTILDCPLAQRVDVRSVVTPLPRDVRPMQGGRFTGPARARVHCIRAGFTS